jgi:uncharacterized protein YbgA (DUF1722 family)
MLLYGFEIFFFINCVFCYKMKLARKCWIYIIRLSKAQAKHREFPSYKLHVNSVSNERANSCWRAKKSLMHVQHFFTMKIKQRERKQAENSFISHVCNGSVHASEK